MANSVIKEIGTKNKNIGMRTYSNAVSITIPLERTQSNSSHANIIVINANQNIFSLISTGQSLYVHAYGENSISVSMDGTNAIVSTLNGSNMWGDTLIIVNANYGLSWGGKSKQIYPSMSLRWAA